MRQRGVEQRRDVPEPQRQRMQQPGGSGAVTACHGIRQAGAWKKRAGRPAPARRQRPDPDARADGRARAAARRRSSAVRAAPCAPRRAWCPARRAAARVPRASTSQPAAKASARRRSVAPAGAGAPEPAQAERIERRAEGEAGQHPGLDCGEGQRVGAVETVVCAYALSGADKVTATAAGDATLPRRRDSRGDGGRHAAAAPQPAFKCMAATATPAATWRRSRASTGRRSTSRPARGRAAAGRAWLASACETRELAAPGRGSRRQVRHASHVMSSEASSDSTVSACRVTLSCRAHDGVTSA